jgi:hypothetical protein
VAVYGVVNAGKSSLINALLHRPVRPTSPIGGTTLDVATELWRAIETKLGPYALRLIDTPGIEEVEGDQRAEVAHHAALRSDLLLFVTAEDLTATALDALKSLHQSGKPIIVVLNKVDLLDDRERQETLTAIREKLTAIVPAENVIPVAAAPIVRDRVLAPDGSSRWETRHGAPEIAVLWDRLLGVLPDAAFELKQLTEASIAVEELLTHTPERAARRHRAERLSDEMAVGIAMALALNPIPALDLLAGPGGLAVLVGRLAALYQANLTRDAVRTLTTELLQGGRIALWGSLVGVGVGGAFKFVPGIGHLAGALTQGASAGVFTHILGRALIHFFENERDWGEGGLLATLERISAQTDRLALTKGLVQALKARVTGSVESDRSMSHPAAAASPPREPRPPFWTRWTGRSQSREW